MKKDSFNLTAPQNSIWLTEQYYQSTNINNICGSLTILKKVDFDKFSKAINIFVENTDSFRIKLFMDNGEIKQYISNFVPFDLEILNVKSDEDVKNIEKEVSNITFNIFDSLLFTFKLFKFEDGHGGFVVNAHHIISDSWTLGIVVNEIIRIYSCLLNDEEIDTTNNLSYVDYIHSEKEYLNSEKFLKNKEYWDNIYSTIPEIATIPNANKVSNKKDYKAKRELFSIPEKILNNINEFCTQNKVSVYNFFMAIFSIYLSKVSNLDDFVIGTPILNRTNFKEKNTAGMFISTIPFRISIDSSKNFKDFVSKIALDSLGMLRHQKYSYQYILENLRKQDSSLPNLYNIMLSYQITKMTDNNDVIPHSTRWAFNETISDDIDIHLFDFNNASSLNIAYDYRVNKYTKNDISAIHLRILNIIEQIIQKNDIDIKNIEIITPEEKNQILFDFNNTSMDYPKDKTIVQLFEDQVEKTPDNIAVVFEDKKLTYKELNEKANQLAHYLRNNNIKNNDIVGIMVNRSLEMIIGIIAILKSGAAYLPIDPDYPIERISYMLDDSNCKMLLTQDKLNKNTNFSNTTINIDLNNSEIYNLPCLNLSNICIPEDLAYIIYTSGSTGKPKGVMLKHKALSNLTNYCNFNVEYLKDNNYRTIVSVTTVSFDIFIFETLISLQKGLKLIIANENEQTIPRLLNKLIEKENIEIIQTTPSRIQLLLNNISEIPNIKNLKYITLAGEQLPISLATEIIKLTNCKLYNGYGPSETTVFSTLTDITNHKQITIGKPLNNTQIYILNNDLQLCPIGIPGEIYISGDGLGKGYLNKKDLTTKSFINNPFIKNSLMYKSGDLGYYTKNGEIICLGRCDNQIKIRGLRIELDEIENLLLKQKNISNCVVVKKFDKDSHEFLCAYYTEKKDSVDIENIRKLLQKQLPNYMIPQYFVRLESLPYTPNGKIDKKSLPMPVLCNKNIEIISPRNNIDFILVDTLKSLLHIDNIGINSSFFDLGGDSLTAINLCMHVFNKIKIQITVKDIIKHPIIKDLSDFISSINIIHSTDTINIAEKKDYYPVSSAQRRIYYASSMDGDNSLLYNIAGGIVLDKQPDIKKLEKCFKILINRHESLRTYFEVIDGDIVQKITENIDYKLNIESSNSDNLDEIFNDFVKPFNLNKAPLFNTKLVNLKNNKTMLLLNMHHIISDGTSLSILVDELCKLYNNIDNLPEIEITYKDFAVWENNCLNSSKFKQSEKFWLNQFNDEIPLLNMPTNYYRPAIQSFEGNSIYTEINNDLLKELTKLSQNLEITPYMLLLSTYYILLYKYTGQDDIIIGSPIVGRDNVQLANIIGMFVNSLALRSKIDSSLSFKEFVNMVKSVCLQAFDNQTYPFDELISKLDIKRDTSRNPLFDTMFIYQNNGTAIVNFDGINSKPYIPNSNISKFDLSLEIIPEKEKLSLHFEYRTKLFNEKFITNLSQHYLNILKVILKNNNIKLADIDILSKEEKNQILFNFNNTFMDYPKDKTIVQLFEEQVEKTPDNIAIVFEDKKLTYKELNEKANQLAHALILNNIEKNEVVGIMLNRSIDTIISMFAVLKANAIYMLIDPTLPEDRILYMLNNANSSLLITDTYIKNIDFENKLYINENTDIYDNTNLNLKYNIENNLSVVYTSGSTGTPKGILLKQKGMVNLIFNYKNMIDLDNISNFLSICSTSFDMFAVEVFIPLLNSKTLFLTNEEEHKSPVDISNIIENNNVEFIMATPSKIQLLLVNESTCNCLKNLKSIQLGGEVLTSTLLNTLRKYTNAQICNEYGPSEITSCCTYKQIYSPDDINIGKPIGNVKVYILNKDMNLCPIGVDGEIYVEGTGISNGYINNPNATNTSFIKNPFGDGLLYKTGDIGRFNSNGEIEYVGRKDFQVKLRGLRIELSEIEKQFLNIPNVKNCAVICKTPKDGGAYLAGFFTSDKNIDISNIRNELSKHLPSYMVPNYIIRLNEMPITRNGKIDLNTLHSYKITISECTNYTAPETEMQKLFCDIWEKLLNTRVGIDNDLFALGADSLLAIKFKVELLSHDIDINYADIFKYPNIRELCEIHDSSNSMEKDNFDYTEINSILNKNDIKNYKKITKNTNNNVLLLGSNGFVGMHILYSFIKNDTGKIYCIVRDKNKLSARTRFLDALHFYFDNELDEYIDNRIIIIKGDITKDNFGLATSTYNDLVENISVVINSSANVKHYGNFKNFENINIGLTKKAIEFCEQYNKRLLQISTTSVCGYTDNNITFSENNLYVGQTLDNVYIKSKFEAEKIILSHIANGLNAQVLRLGNITSRFSDGKFQINADENAFVSRLQSLIKLGVIPDYLLNMNLEFTPVDLCGDAIIKIMQNYIKDYSVFHLFNNNSLTMKEFIDILDKLDFHLEIVSNNAFNKILKEVLLDENKKDILSGIINDLNKDNNIELSINSNISADFTNIFLDNFSFKWSKIDRIYIEKYIDYLKNIKFI